MAPETDDRDAPLPPDPRQRGRDREMWVGVFVIVGILATFGLLFVLTDAATFRGRYILTTVVPNAGGIRRGDPVQMRGVIVADVVHGESTKSLKNGDTIAGKSEEAMMDQTNRIAGQVETVLKRV